MEAHKSIKQCHVVGRKRIPVGVSSHPSIIQLTSLFYPFVHVSDGKAQMNECTSSVFQMFKYLNKINIFSQFYYNACRLQTW